MERVDGSIDGSVKGNSALVSCPEAHGIGIDELGTPSRTTGEVVQGHLHTGAPRLEPLGIQSLSLKPDAGHRQDMVVERPPYPEKLLCQPQVR